MLRTSGNRLKHLESATEQYGKFEDELAKFKDWMTSAENTIDKVVLEDIDSLKSVVEKHKVRTIWFHLVLIELCSMSDTSITLEENYI